MLRSEIRDNAFKLIFEQLLRGDDINELYEIAEEIDEIKIDNEVKKIVNGTIEYSNDLDKIIESYSKSRRLSRISKINHSILRLSLYECIHDKNTPENAAISEAIKLALKYSYKEDVSFINGVLGAFSRDRRNAVNKRGKYKKL